MTTLSAVRALAGITTHAGRRLGHEVGRRTKSGIKNHVGLGSSGHLLLDLCGALLLVAGVFARCFAKEERCHAGHHTSCGGGSLGLDGPIGTHVGCSRDSRAGGKQVDAGTIVGEGRSCVRS